MSPRRRIPEGQLDESRTFSRESSHSAGDFEANELDETMPYSPTPRRLARVPCAGSGCTSTTGSGCTSTTGSGCTSTSSRGSEGDDPSNKLLAMDLYILANCSREKDLDEEYVMDAVRHLHGLCSIKVVESHHFTKKRVLEPLKAVLEGAVSSHLKLEIAKLLLQLWEDSSYWGRVRITNLISDQVILKHFNGTENEQLEKIAYYLQEEYYRLSSNL